MARNGYWGGDAILLRGGRRFAGTICLGTENLRGASDAQPFTIGSYGGGRATIVAPSHTDGIAAIDVGGIRVRDVELIGRRDVCNKDPSNGYRYGSAETPACPSSLMKSGGWKRGEDAAEDLPQGLTATKAEQPSHLLTHCHLR